MNLFHVFSFMSRVGKDFFSFFFPFLYCPCFFILLQLNTVVSGPGGARIIGDWGSRESEFSCMFYIIFFFLLFELVFNSINLYKI